MNFFNKYKDLFGVPATISLPSSRLQLDNELFIQKPYISTKTQQYTLNSKLKQFRKDYDEFQNALNQINKLKNSTKRTSSRKGTLNQSKIITVTQNKYEDSDQNLKPRPASNGVTSKEKEKMKKQSLQRQSWLRDQQNNILKHSQIDHIFKNKLTAVYDLDDIKPSTLPRPNIQGQSYEYKSLKQNPNFIVKHRSKPNLQTKKQRLQSNTMDNALSRRQKAKQVLQFRRKKLQNLLKSLW